MVLGFDACAVAQLEPVAFGVASRRVTLRCCRGALTLLVMLGVLAVCLPPSASAVTTPPEPTWVTNGDVDAIAVDGGSVYIGGRFSYVGPNTGAGVVLSASAAAPLVSLQPTEQNCCVFAATGTRPAVGSSVSDVNASVADGAGGYFVAGSFNAVEGVPAQGVVHILANGSVDRKFAAKVTNGTVDAFALSGSTLYLGGTFSAVDGSQRLSLAAVNATTGRLSSWNPHVQPTSCCTSDDVRSLVVSGSTVYAGGAFSKVGQQARANLAAINVATGMATAWNPSPNQPVNALVLSGSTLYVGGAFTSIGGVSRDFLAALDATTGAATSWDPNPGPVNTAKVVALVLSGTTLYVGGAFTTIGGEPRTDIGAVDAVTGAATAWDPDVDGVVNTLALSGSTLYAGGQFGTIAGQTRHGLAAIDGSSGLPSAWNPNPDGRVSTVSSSGGTVFAGGSFNSVDGVARSNVAAIDATTGSATGWDPEADSTVTTLAADGSTIYAGGFFSEIGGQPRVLLAALDATTGVATPWNPQPNRSVNAITVSGSTVYVGGSFNQVGGVARSAIAALDPLTGLATPWDPDGNGAVDSIAVAGPTVYAGGAFSQIGGQTRNLIAALDANTGQATAWNPNGTLHNAFDPSVNAIAPDGATVYVGGHFTQIGGQTRQNLASLSASTGAATPWNPSVSDPDTPAFTYPTVDALTVSGPTVYAGGYMTQIAGQKRAFVAALSATKTAVTSWNPSAGDRVNAIAVTGSSVYVGGDFSAVGTLTSGGFAAFPLS